MTAIEWCDLVFDSNLEDRVNNELIKWCEAFLDEGHATWSMPGREKGFYEAWRALAMNEWSTCGIRNSNNKIRALSIDPIATVFEKLNALCIPKEYWQDYHVPTRQEYVHDTWLRTRATRESMSSYANDYQ